MVYRHDDNRPRTRRNRNKNRQLDWPGSKRRAAARDMFVEPLEERILLARYDGSLTNVGPDLREIVNEYDSFVAGGGNPSEFVSSRADDFRLDGGSIHTEVRVGGDFDSLSSQLVDHGFEISAAAEDFGLIEGGLPLGKVTEIATTAGIMSVLPVWSFTDTDAQGSVANEAEISLGADAAKALFGVDGTGASIGVISDSANRVGGGLADSQSTGDLPAAVNVVIAGPAGASDEGRAMLELIYDIAPGAALAFASGVGGDAAMAAAINALAGAGSNIIVDDLNGLTSEPFFQDGAASTAVTNAVAAGATYFTSAGNRGESGYEAPLSFVGGTIDGLNGFYHDFDGAGDLTQAITLQQGVTRFVFQFDQPFGNVTTDVDIYLLDAAGTIIAGGVDDNTVTNVPREVFTFDNTTGAALPAQIAIRSFGGPNAPTRFKWIGFNNPSVDEHLGVAGALNNPHNPGHNGNPNAISVAASPFDNPTVPEAFSSRGPVTRTLDAAGNRIPLVTYLAPSITSNDKVSTTVPGFATFFGTSAAAPNAAAVAALLVDFDNSLTPAGVRSSLETTAIDIFDPGFDLKTGNGLIDAVRAMLDVSGGVLALNGDRSGAATNDNFVLNINGADNSLLDITLNGILLGSAPTSLLTQITVNGLAGSDTLIVNHQNGLVQVPISYNGGAGASDALVSSGNPGGVTSAAYTTGAAGADGNTGQLSYVAGGGATATITFTGLEPVEDLVPAATLTINDTATANVVNLVDGPLSTVNDPIAGSLQTTYQVNFGGLAEEINFRNKGQVTINALGGNDAITVDIGATSLADGLTAMTINAGDGNDTANINRSQINAGYTGLTVNAGNGNDSINLTTSDGTNTIVPDSVTVEGDAGSDSVVINDQLNLFANAWTVTDATVTRNIFGGLAYGTIQNLTLNAQNVGAVTAVQSTAAGVTTTVNAGGGSDTVQVGSLGLVLDSIAGPLSITGGPGNDSVVLNDQGNGLVSTYTVGPTTVNRTGLANPIGYDTAVQQLTLNTGSNNDTINAAPSPATEYTVNASAPAFFANPGDTLNLNLAGTTGANLLVTGPGGGRMTFSSAHQPFNYTEVELLNSSGPFDIVIDANASGAANDTIADTFLVNLDPTGANLNLWVNGTLVFNAPESLANSLTVNGSNDDDSLTVDGTNGLPEFQGNVPTSLDNQNIAGAPHILFNGSAGSDQLIYTGLASGFDQTYAIGDGNGGGFGATTSEGEMLTMAGGDSHQIYFTGLEPALTQSIGGDTLTVIGDLNANTLTVTASALVNGGTAVNETAGPYESLHFAPGAFETLRVFGHDGTDTIDVIGLGAGENELDSIVLDGRRDTGVDDNVADTLRVRTNTRPADGVGIPTQLFGGGGNDNFLIFDAQPTVDLILGSVDVEGGAGNDVLAVGDSGSVSGASETVTITGTTIAGITGPTGNGGLITYNNLNAGRVVISGSPAGHVFNVLSTAAGLTETELNTGFGADTVNINDGGGTANGVVSPIDLNALAGIDTLNIVDIADGASNRYHMNATTIGGGFFNAAMTTGGIFGPGGILFYDAGLQVIDVDAGDAGNEFNIDATGVGGAAPVARVTIDDGSGSSIFNIQANALAGGADHTFNGNGGSELMNVFLAAGTVVTGNSVVLNGHAPTGTNTRDVVNVIDAGGQRTTNVAYQSAASGDVNVQIDAGTLLDINTVETMTYIGDGANDDDLTVVGTGGDDDLTTAPLARDEAMVFIGGNPWDGPSDSDAFPDAIPGVAGGSAGPDLRLDGLAGTTGLTLDGGGAGIAGDQLYVYAPSETALVDAGTVIDPFGFGVGALIPGFNPAYDQMTVTDTRVTTNNVGGAGPLVDVNINAATFVQADPQVPGLFVNSGFEANPGGTSVADDITAVLSFQYALQINGGNPVPSFAPAGDRLDVITPGEINVFSDKNTPPEVTITSSNPLTGQASFGLTFSSIESVFLTPGLTSQTANIFGDNDEVEVDQPDNYVVTGADVDSTLVSLATLALNPAYNPTGATVHPDFDVDPDGDNEFFLEINGSAPIGFRNVAFLNVLGDDSQRTPSDGDDIDRLELTPYADDTPTGWGIDVRFDEGNPIADAIDAPDMLVYNGVAGVSEDIIIAPSAPETGQLRVTNAATGTPIVVIDYTTNTGMEVNGNSGAAGDIDRLVMQGTGGADTVAADFTASGGAGAPLVTVSDTASGDIYYELFSISQPLTFGTVNFELMDGDDTLSLNSGTVTANVDAGAGDDVLSASASTAGVFLAGAGGDDTITGGSGGDRLEGGSGNDQLTGGPGADAMFGNQDSDVLIWNNGDGSDLMEGGTGNDVVVVNGADGAGDDFDVAADGTRVSFSRTNLGLFTLDIAQTEQLDVNGQGGGDSFVVGNLAATELRQVNVDAGAGGDAESVTVDGTPGDDDLTVSSSGGAIQVNGLPYGVNISGTSVADGDQLTVRGGEGNDRLSVGPGVAIAVVTIDGGGGDDLLSGSTGNEVLSGGSGNDVLLISGGDDTAIGGDGFDVVQLSGNDADNVLDVSQADGLITVAGHIAGTVDVSSGDIERVDVLGLDGDDQITLTGLTIPALASGGADHDAVDASGVAAVSVALSGDAGNDELTGGLLADRLDGGDGNDLLVGGPGDDLMFGGADSDVLVWNNGDNSDLMEGGTGNDVVVVNGADGGADEFATTANGTRVSLARANLVPFVLDIAQTEQLDVNGLGGADQFDVGNLAATELRQVNIDAGAGGDAESVTVSGTPGDDDLTVSAAGGAIQVNGLSYGVNITGTSIADGDQLTVLGGEGNDRLSVGPGVATAVVTIDGGGGNDVLSGSDGNEVLAGGTGDDVLVVSGGDDVVSGGDGFDVLQLSGNDADNVLDVSQAGGLITVAGHVNGTVDVSANDVERVDVLGLGGDDQITLTGLAIPALADGGAGNDTVDASGLTAVEAALVGGGGNDSLTGGALGDRLDGGAGNDLLVGGPGNDAMFGGADSDVLVWNNGDNDDLMEGGSGDDTVIVNGADAGDDFVVTPNGIRVSLARTNLIPFVLDIAQTEQLDVNAGGGDDSITVGDLGASELRQVNVDAGPAGDRESVTVDGTAGDDNILVSASGSVVIAGLSYMMNVTGTSVADGDRLTVRGGEGNDILGAGSGVESAVLLTLEGGAGQDQLTGSPGNDVLDGGDDDDVLNVTDGDDLFLGGSGFDIIQYSGNESDEFMSVDQFGNVLLIAGSQNGTVTDAQGDLERIDVLGRGGDDIILLSSLAIPARVDAGEGHDVVDGGFVDQVSLILLGGAGSDVLIGGNAPQGDTIDGGSGDDAIVGGGGFDLIFGGADSDVISWSTGDGFDVVEGGTGNDRVLMDGSPGDDEFTVEALGTQVLVSLTPEQVRMAQVEHLEIDGSDGGDSFTLGDLSVTELERVDLDMGVPGSIDSVFVLGTANNDSLRVTGSGGVVSVAGLSYAVNISDSNAGDGDQLTVDGGDGDDTMSVGDGVVGLINVVLQGGAGNDHLAGGPGNDVLDGGSGDDILHMSDGDDVLVGGSGFDIVQVDGNEGDNTIAVSQLGNILAVAGFINGTADVGSDDLERVDVLGYGGDDLLSAAGVQIPVVLDGGSGSDILDASGLDSVSATLLGGSGDDDLRGGQLDDRLEGDAGNDLLDGGPGDDAMFGGADSDTLVWNNGDNSDLMEGGTGNDRVIVNGAAGSDDFDLSANGTRVQFDRFNLIPFTLDIAQTEQIDMQGSGGGDSLTVGDLSRSELAVVIFDTGQAGLPDQVTVDGTATDDNILISADEGGVLVGGLSYDVNISGTSVDDGDRLTVRGGAGDDTLSIAEGVENAILVTLEGGIGQDLLTGGAGNDTLDGGSDDDILEVSPGDDVLLGGSEFDIVRLSGNEAPNFLSVSQVGSVLQFGGFIVGTGDVVADDVERVDVNGHGADDLVVAGELAIPLLADGGDGNDQLDAGAVTAVNAILHGGLGDDFLIGGALNDRLFGGPGVDVLDGRSGSDQINGDADSDTIIVSDPGIDRVEGGTGDDLLNVVAIGFDAQATPDADHVWVTAGDRAARAGSVEQLNVAADNYVIGDLGHSSTRSVGISFYRVANSATIFNSSGTVRIDGSAQSDEITVVDSNLHSGAFGGSNFGVTPTAVMPWGHIAIYDVSAQLDYASLTIRGLSGDDSITVEPSASLGATPVILDGGTGNDSLSADGTLLGGDGDDLLRGGAGDNLLDGGDGNDTFVGGGGTDIVIGGSGGDTILAEGTPAADFVGISLVPPGASLDVFVNGATTSYTDQSGTDISLASVERLLIETGDGDDVITTVPLPNINQVINAGGPQASDLLQVTVPANAHVAYGVDATTGTVDQTGGGDIDFIDVELLEIESNGEVATLSIDATNGDDAVAMGPNGTGTSGGRVSVNHGTVVSFNIESSAFDTLNVGGLAGSDEFAVTPLAGVAVNIEGGEPSASDHVVVNGTAFSDRILVNLLDADSATVRVNQLGLVSLDTIEGVTINGIGGTNLLDVTTPAGTHRTTLATGTVVDSASISTVDSLGAGLMPLDFTTLGPFAQLTLSDASGGRSDVVEVLGTGANDYFFVLSNVMQVYDGDQNFIPRTVVIAPRSADTLELRGLDGADRFDLEAPLPFAQTVVRGNDPESDGDVLNYSGSGGDITLDLATQSFAETGLGSVVFSTLEEVSFFSAGADVSINGTGNDDAIGYQPMGPNRGQVTLGGTNTVYNANNVADLDIAGNAGVDTLTVNATNDDDTINIDDGSVEVVGRQPVAFDGFEALEVNALQGDDTINAVPGGTPLTVDGGLPVASDIMNLVVGGSARITQGADSTTGLVDLTGGSDISFANIEQLNIDSTGQGGLTVRATNDNDTIAVQPVTSLGRASGRVWVNDGTVITANNQVSITASLDGNQEVPPVGTSATGSANLVYNHASGTYDLDIVVSGIALVDLFASHIHVGAAGVNGPVVVDLDASQFFQDGNNIRRTIDGWALPQSVLNDLLSGNTYVNLHTTSSRGGEIRGQLAPITVLSNFDSLELDGRFGNDHFSITPIDNVSITANGGDPTGSDVAVINGSPTSDVITYSPLSPDSANVVVNSAAPVMLATMESASIQGLGGADQLTVWTPGGSDAIEYTPTSTTSAAVGFGDLLDVDFSLPGAGSAVRLTDTTQSRVDSLSFNGSDLDDAFGVNSSAQLSFANATGTHLPVNPEGVADITLNGLGGDDSFNVIGGNSLQSLNVHGGGPDGGDTLNVTNPQSGVVVDFGNQVVSGFGAPIAYSSLARINASVFFGEGGATSFAAIGTVGDDDIVVIPLNGNSGTVQANGDTPVVFYSGTAVAGIDGGAGEDTVVVVGSASAENIVASDSGVSTPGGTVLFNIIGFTVESLSVNGLEGSDVFDVSPGLIPIFIDGGDPIGVNPGGDVLNVVGAGGLVALFAGPENDEGAFVAQGAQAVSFDHIESAQVGPGQGPAVVFGTNGDDDITVIARDDSTHDNTDGIEDYTISVNAGFEVLYIDRPTLLIDGLSGDDDFVVRGPAPNNAVWNVQTTLVGGPGDDRLSFETPGAGAESVFFTPTGVETGNFDVPTITSSIGLSNVPLPIFAILGRPVIGGNGGFEQVTYDGENDGDLLTIVGATDNDQIVHTPGGGFDEGTVRVDNLLGLAYEDLGAASTLNLDGSGGNDTLVANGTGANDNLNVAPTGTVFVNNQLPLNTTAENLVINALEGDDDVRVDAPLSYATVTINGGGPGAGSDTLHLIGAEDSTSQSVSIAPDSANSDDQRITGLGSPIGAVGIELINYRGTSGADSLLVDLGAGDNTARVAAGSNSDVIQSDSLPAIEFSGLDAFNVVASQGNDVVTFVTRNLTGASRSNYFIQGTTGATLAIEGADGGADNYVVQPGANGQVAVSDNASAITVTATGATGRLELNTLGGDDLVTVDLSNADLPNMLITYNGGPNSDLLQVQGTPTGSSTDATYAPGPAEGSGRLTYVGGATTTIDFTGLEPVIDLVPGTLTVVGTAGNNAINYSAMAGNAAFGTVTIDGHESINFTNKTSLALDGRAGDDVVNLRNAATPTGLTQINVTGGDGTTGDALIVNGTSGSDAIGYTPTGADAATVTGVLGVGSVTVDTVEALTINGLGGNDVLTTNTNAGNSVITLTPGSTPDSGRIDVDSDLGVDFANLGGQGFVELNDAGGIDQLAVNGTAASDTFFVPSTSGAAQSIELNGQIDVTTSAVEAYTLRGLGGDDTFNVEPQAGILINVEGDEPSGSDTLNFSRVAGGATTVVVDLDSDPSGDFTESIVQPGFAPVIHSGVETVNVDANDADVFVSGTRFNDEITVRPRSESSATITADTSAATYNLYDVPSGRDLTVTGGGTGLGGPAGGGFADRVAYVGTAGSDLIRVNSLTREVSLAIQGFGFPPPVISEWRAVTLDDGSAEAGSAGVVEVVDVRGGDANDTFHVVPGAPVGNGLFINVDGGNPQASDALVVTSLTAQNAPTPLAASDFVVVSKSRNPDAGNVLVFQSAVRRPNIAYENVEVLSPNVSSTAGDPNLLVLGPDHYEENEFRQTAAFLGAGQTLNVSNLAVFPNINEHPGVPADQDYFRVVAEATGTLDFQVYFRSFNVGLLPEGGNIDIRVLDSAGNEVAGFGSDDATPNARVRIPAVAGQTYYLHVAGANNLVVNGYDLTVINTPPPVPYDLELDDLPVGDGLNSDTGRSQFDNITRDSTPAIVFRLDDAIFLHDLPGNPGDDTPPDEVIPIPFQGAALQSGYRVAVFVEGPPQQPGQLPQSPVGYARQTAEGVYEFDFATDALASPFTLTDGSHFISARVEMIDPATPAQTGFGLRSDSLEIIVDTVAPNATFGNPLITNDGLHPDSDSGVDGYPATITDNATNDTTPTFFGIAEADAFIRLYLDVNLNGVIDPTDLLIGQTVAVPLDGSNQFPGGQWEATSTIDFNDPDFGLPHDGLRRVLVTGEDPAGNISNPDSLFVFLDTQGPRVTQVFITGSPGFDLFDPKPSAGPTPLVNSLTIRIQDLPIRLIDFLLPPVLPQVATNSGHYTVRGDHNGIIPISRVTFATNPINGQPATGTIVLEFFEPLPDDRFTLTISDAITDPVGNPLDGESNANEPQENPSFPSGDGVPGGDFVARFTVDSRPEVGVWAAGNVWVDTNGNFVFDPDNSDFTNRDIIYALGFTSDDIFAGNFSANSNSVADGYDKLAAYGRVGTEWRWMIDTDNNGVPNIEVTDAAAINGLPVAGRFDNNDANGDEVGAFTGTTWYFDINHDFNLDAGTALTTSMRGYPVVGDFDGDGFDDLATWADDTYQVDLAGGVRRGWDGVADFAFRYGFIGIRERPAVADMDQDGFEDFGLWVPDRAGVAPEEAAEWYFLVSGGSSVLNRIRTDPVTGVQLVDYTPVPFGDDIYGQFGEDYALPVVGNFDPPVTSGGGDDDDQGGGDNGEGQSHSNPRNPLDVNDDGLVSPMDALVLINHLNIHGSGRLMGQAESAPYLDVNSDGFALPLDTLMVVNHLNAAAGGEGESAREIGEEPTTSDENAAVSSLVVDSLIGVAPEFKTSTEAGPQPQLAADSVDVADPVSPGHAANESLDWLLAATEAVDDLAVESIVAEIADEISEFQQPIVAQDEIFGTLKKKR